MAVPIDKLSILLPSCSPLLFSKEKLSVKAWIGLALLTVGTVLMVVFAT